MPSPRDLAYAFLQQTDRRDDALRKRREADQQLDESEKRLAQLKKELGGSSRFVTFGDRVVVVDSAGAVRVEKADDGSGLLPKPQPVERAENG